MDTSLDDAAATGKIIYHPKCEEAGLTHLCFADDLLIFSDGSASSVRGILSSLMSSTCCLDLLSV